MVIRTDGDRNVTVGEGPHVTVGDRPNVTQPEVPKETSYPRQELNFIVGTTEQNPIYHIKTPGSFITLDPDGVDEKEFYRDPIVSSEMDELREEKNRIGNRDLFCKEYGWRVTELKERQGQMRGHAGQLGRVRHDFLMAYEELEGREAELKGQGETPNLRGQLADKFETAYLKRGLDHFVWDDGINRIKDVILKPYSGKEAPASE